MPYTTLDDDFSYVSNVPERGESPDKGNSHIRHGYEWSKGKHDVNFGVEFWAGDHGDEEDRAAKRVANEGELFLASPSQDVVYGGRHVIPAYLVTSVSSRNSYDSQYFVGKVINKQCISS